MSTPRNIIQVIYLMLEQIPVEERALRKHLENHATANLYRAPEAQGWDVVARTLQHDLDGRAEPWVESVLRIWRDEKCEACQSGFPTDGIISGVLANGERCDACEIYPDDNATALAIQAAKNTP